MTPSRKARPNAKPPIDVRADAASISLARLRDDREAFATLFHAYYETLYDFAYRYVRSRETAEELVQDVFFRLWERRSSLPATKGEDEISTTRAYLYRAVRNAALSWIRHARVEYRLALRTDPTTEPPGMGSAPPSADATMQQDEIRQRLRRAVAALPEPYRDVLVLRSEHQLSYPEIAAVLQVSLKTVESRVTRAFRTLRETLDALR